MSDHSVDHSTIIIDRRFRSAPGRVFAAWADPGARRRWDVPGGDWRYVEHAHDFRVGGMDVLDFGPPDDLRYQSRTRYEDIVVDARIVMSYSVWTDDVPMSVSLLTVEFRPVGTGTHMVVTEQAVFLDGRDSPDTRRHGLAEMLEQLAAQLDPPNDHEV